MRESCDNLVELAKAGDLRAFDALVSLHQDRVHALAYRMLGHEDDAADVQQETFVQAWKNLRKFRGNSQFSTWLHRITVNLCLSRKRRKAIISEPLEEHLRLHSSEPGPAACLEQTETIATVRRVLDNLPVHYRVLIVLREMEERSYDEIAEVLGCSIESVRTRLHKARKLLREKMRPYIEEENAWSTSAT